MLGYKGDFVQYIGVTSARYCRIYNFCIQNRLNTCRKPRITHGQCRITTFMKKRFLSLIVTLLTTWIVHPINAAVSQGDFEANLSLAIADMSTDDLDLDVTLITGSVGYFFTENIQVSGVLSRLSTDVPRSSGGERSVDSTLVGAAVDYHFNTESKFVPYAGLGLYLTDSDLEELGVDDTAFQVRGGVKHFLSDTMALKYSISYIDFSGLDLNGFALEGGFSYFF